MSNIVRVFLLVALIVTVSCDSTPVAPDQSDAPLLKREGTPDHGNVRTPFTFTFFNSCGPLPEPVTVEGFAHTVTHFKFFEGGNHFRMLSHAHGTGLGTLSGDRYVFNQIGRTSAIFDEASDTFDSQQRVRFLANRQGSPDNFFLSSHMHIVCTGSTCTAEVISSEVDCRG